MEYTFNELKNDPDFLKLSPEDQSTILNDNDEDFRKLSPEDQTTIIKDLSTDISTVTGQPTAELEEFPDYMKAGDVAADLAPPVAATIMGALGAGAGAGPGSIPLGLTAAGVGGYGGEILRQSWYGLTGRGEIPETTTGILKRAGIAGLEEMAWETAGLAIGSLFRPLRRVGRGAEKAIDLDDKIFTPEQLSRRASEDVQGLLTGREIRKEGTLTYGEAMDGGFLRSVVENIENIGTLGKHNIGKARKAEIVEKAVKEKMFRDFESGKKLPDMLGTVLRDENTAWRTICDANYAAINTSLHRSAAMQGKSLEFIDTKVLKQGTKEILDTARKAGVGGDVVTDLERILEMPPLVSFETAKLRWTSMYNTTDKTLKKQLKGLGTVFKKDVRKQAENFDTSGGVSAAWKIVDKVYKEGKKLFDDKIIKKIMGGMSSDDLYKQLIKPDNGDNINLIKKAMSGEISIDPRAATEGVPQAKKSQFVYKWKELQRKTYDKVLEEATDIEGVLGGKRLKAELKKLGSTADAVFSSPFSKDKDAVFKDSINSLADHLIKLETSQAKVTAKGTFTTLAILGVGGAGYGLMTGEDPIGALKNLTIIGGVCYLSSAALGKFTRTRTGLKILKTLTKTPVSRVGDVVRIVGRGNRFLERREKREAWLEQREKKRTSEIEKETPRAEQPETEQLPGLLRKLLPTQHPKTKPIINQTVGGTRASLGGNNDFLTQLLLS